MNEQLITVVERSIWQCKQTGKFYIVTSLTPRMAVMHSCDRAGRTVRGFTISVRQSTLKRDYRIKNVI